MPKISILTITYNSSSTILDCLAALNSQSFEDFEVIIVDNNSIDNTRELVDAICADLKFPTTRLYLTDNLGFAGGNNLALQRTNAPYIAALNPDAFPEAAWLHCLISAMESDPNVGICGSKLVIADSDRIDSAGDCYATTLKAFKRGEGKHKDRWAIKEYVFGACAGAALYRRSMIDDIGFFDEEFFLIHEDTDLNLRANLAGWKVLYVPQAVVHHKAHSSIGKRSELQTFYNLRNTELVRLKSVPLMIILKYLPIIFIGLITEFIYFVIRHGQMRVYMRAKGDAIRLAPAMWKKRRMIMKKRRVNNRHIDALLTSLWEQMTLTNRIRRFLWE